MPFCSSWLQIVSIVGNKSLLCFVLSCTISPSARAEHHLTHVMSEFYMKRKKTNIIPSFLIVVSNRQVINKIVTSKLINVTIRSPISPGLLPKCDSSIICLHTLKTDSPEIPVRINHTHHCVNFFLSVNKISLSIY